MKVELAEMKKARVRQQLAFDEQSAEPPPDPQESLDLEAFMVKVSILCLRFASWL